MSKIIAFFMGLGRTRKIIAASGVVVILIAAAATVALQYSAEEFMPLYTGLDSGSMTEAAATLKTMGIDYRVEGRTISVPESSILGARRGIEAVGTAKTEAEGYELFDRTGFFVSEFTQRVDYARALQGELAKTIGRIKGVESAAVHIALPEKGIFLGEEKKASAAVILKFRSGAAMTRPEAVAIAHLVAAGVPQLVPANVTIIDTDGRMMIGGGYDAGPSASAPVYGRAAEIEMEGRLQSILDKAVGRGRAVVSVSVDMVTPRRAETTGQVRRMSIAVVIGGGLSQTAEGMDIKGLEAIIKAASGFSDERGDVLSIMSSPMPSVGAAKHVAAPPVNAYAGGGLLFGFYLVFGIFVVALIIFRAVQVRKAGVAALEVETLLERLALAGAKEARQQGGDAAKDLRDLARKDPRKAAAVLRAWVRE